MILKNLSFIQKSGPYKRLLFLLRWIWTGELGSARLTMDKEGNLTLVLAGDLVLYYRYLFCNCAPQVVAQIQQTGYVEAQLNPLEGQKAKV